MLEKSPIDILFYNTFTFSREMNITQLKVVVFTKMAHFSKYSKTIVLQTN